MMRHDVNRWWLFPVVMSAWTAVVVASAEDWPMWRCDAARSGASREDLPAELQLQWTVPLGAVTPAWPHEPRLWFDASYEPVVAGDTLVVGSSIDGSVLACDVATGRPRWRFFTEGPVRFAPALTAGRLLVASDDGYLYALRLKDGTLLWRVRGAPDDRPDRRLLGNNRLISAWPVRGGPVVADGSVYFAAGLWPTEGVFVVALDAETGAVRWRNDSLAMIENVRLDHNEVAASGLSPQGYLAVHGDLLLVPNGRSLPAGLDRRTGQLVYYIQGYRNGDCRVIAGDQVALVGESGVVDLRTGREVGSRWAAAGADAPKAFDPARFHLFEGPIHPYKMFPGCNWRSVLADGLAYGLEGGVLYAHDLRRAGVSEYDSKDGDRVLKPWRWDAPLVWKSGEKPAGAVASPLMKAGARLYGYDGKGLVAFSVSASGQTPQVTWRSPLDDAATSLIAAAGRLFVATKKGELRCYGPRAGAAAFVPVPAAEPPAADEAADGIAATVLDASGVRAGYGVLLGVGRGAVLRELLRRSELKLIGVDENRDAINALRAELAGQGVYGSRVELFVGDPARFPLPPYLASLIVVQTAPASDAFQAQATRLFPSLRPYGGTLCVPLTADQQPAFEQGVAAARLEQAAVRRLDAWSVLTRVGPLPGSAAWTHESGDAGRSYYSQDQRVRPPLTMLWYGDGPDHGFWKHKDYGTGVKPQVVGGRVIAFQIDTSSLISYDAYTGRLLWKQAVHPFTRYVCREDGIYVAGGNQLRVLDPASGTERAAWPLEIEPGQKPFVADVRVDGEVIVAALAAHKVRVIEQGLWDSSTLVALDRPTGQTLWRRTAEQRFNNHALALGGGLVYAIDSRSPTETDKAQRQGETAPGAEQPSTILALDARTGQVRWSQVVRNPFRTYGLGGWTAMRANDDWLAYSQPRGLLLAGKFNRAAAYDAQHGDLVWESQVPAGQPWILRGDTALSQTGQLYDLRTGKPTGTAYSLSRGGCNYAVANAAAIFLRDRSACYIDVDTRQKRSLYAVRSGCSNSLVAADGVLSVPNFAVGCICNYPVQTSFAMVSERIADDPPRP